MPGATPGPATTQRLERIADLERQLSEAHAQIIEAMRTVNELSRAGADATRRLTVLASLQQKADRKDETIGPRGRQQQQGFLRREIPVAALLKPNWDVEAEFDRPSRVKP